MLHHWRDRWLRPQRRSSRRDWADAKRPRRAILNLESLEDRSLLSFAAPIAFDVGAAPAGVAVGHFEGVSAPLDVVTANANGTVSVLLGKGDGTVQNPILLTVGGTPDGVAVGDFLGNGRDDIAVANSNGTVAVILSNGNGTFKAPEILSLGASPTSVAVGDFTSDGKLDIVTANNDGTITVLPGKGDGIFGTPVKSTIGGSFTSVAVGDLNGDHKLDLVVGTSTGLETLLGKGDGTFQLKQTVTFSHTVHGFTFTFAVNSAAVSSLRSNNINDVVALSTEGLAVLLGNGDGTVQNPVFVDTGGSTPSSFVIGDFNGDKKLDIVASDGAQYQIAPSLDFLAGKGDGTFAAPKAFTVGEAATSLAAGDFRGDGKLDIVLATNLSNSVSVVSGNGDGTFATAPAFGSVGLATSIAAGDFNGDGKPDIVTAGASLSVLLNNGNGTFHQGQSIPLNGFGGPVVVGDFNGDGKLDVAVALGDTIDIFLGNGNGTFQSTPKVINLGTNEVIQDMVVGNFVKGGLPDLAISVVFESGTVPAGVQIFVNKGGGNFVKGQTINFSSDTNGLATGDFRGDGNVDLVTDTFNNDGTRSVNVLLSNGNGTFKAPIVTNTGFSPNIVASGDFTGDGKSDLVLIDYFQADNDVLVLKGNGDGTFQKPLVLKFDIPLGFAQPVVGDFFGDGHMSFALTTGTGFVTVVRGNGDGTFQAPVNYLVDINNSNTTGLVAADFTGDGKLDLAATGLTNQDVSVLLNNSPKPATGAVATTTTLTADNTTVVSGQEVTLTATVTASSGTATGSITFFDGSQILGIVALDPNGQARLLVPFLAGIHNLHASFAGTEPFTASPSTTLTETVNKDATTTTLSVQKICGTLFNLSATVLPVPPGGGTPTGTLTFFDGNKLLGTVSVGSTLAVHLAAGEHHLRVVYSGDSNFLGSTSSTVDLTV